MEKKNENTREDKFIIYDNRGEIKYESATDELTSMLVWKNAKKRELQLKKESAILRREYGDKIFMFQYAMIRASKELSSIGIRVFNFIIGNLDWENWIKIKQGEVAKELETNRTYINKAFKELSSKGFIEKKEIENELFYRVNPEILWKGNLESWKKEIDFIKEKKKREKIKTDDRE